MSLEPRQRTNYQYGAAGAELGDMSGRAGIMAQVRLLATYLIKKLCNCIEQSNRFSLFIPHICECNVEESAWFNIAFYLSQLIHIFFKG